MRSRFFGPDKKSIISGSVRNRGFEIFFTASTRQSRLFKKNLSIFKIFMWQIELRVGQLGNSRFFSAAGSSVPSPLDGKVWCPVEKKRK